MKAPRLPSASTIAWRLALTVVSLAALGVTGWSLYAVARHYAAPEPVGVGAVAVFDGAAYACLHLASQASAAGRSALGARLASLGIASLSVYLNRFHAELIDGGRPATVLFSAPTLALLIVSELSWAGPRAKARAELGRTPYALPVFGGWGWLLAPCRAWSMVRTRAADHIDRAEPAPTKPKDRSATAALRDHFASMDPAAAIRIAHESQPTLAPAELAGLLGTYGVTVDAVQVALVLGGQPPRVTVDRDDTNDAPDDAPQVGELPRGAKAVAIREAASLLGQDARAADVAAEVAKRHRLTVDEPYVRTVLSRAKKQTQPEPEKGTGGYA